MQTSPNTPTGTGIRRSSRTYTRVCSIGGPMSAATAALVTTPAADHTVVSVGP